VTAGFTQRLRASGLSPWELGDLLGIHPHQLAHINTAGLSTQRPIAVLIELSRQLDMHPADLIADLDGVLTKCRLPDDRRYGDDHGNDRHAGQLDCEADTLVLLAALAHARTPLSVDDLARTLGWPLERVDAALGHAHHHPGLAGPMALRRVPPESFTLTPRLDVLTAGQQQAIQATTSWTNVLAEDEAIVLLGALAYGHGPQYATFRDTDQHRHADATLKRAGILYSDHGPHHVSVSDDVLYSLRYRDDTHIANVSSEHARR
jgi:hypothetical protein